MFTYSQCMWKYDLLTCVSNLINKYEVKHLIMAVTGINLLKHANLVGYLNL